MKRVRILKSLMVVAVVATLAVGSSIAFFSDTAESTGNIFQAGAVELAIRDIMHEYMGGEEDPTGFGTGWNDDGMFFRFRDLKPLDWGSIEYTLRNRANEAHVCVMAEAREDLSDGPLGEMLSFHYGGSHGYLSEVSGEWYPLMESPLGEGAEVYPTVDYCFGMYVDDECMLDPMANYNDAQRSTLGVDLSFYAVQTRNNEEFDCSSLNYVASTGENWSPVDLDGKLWFAKARNLNNNFETAVGTDDASPSGQDTAEAVWDAGVEYKFNLEYDSSTGVATWYAGPTMASYTVGMDSYSNIGITVKAPSGVTTTVSDVMLSVAPGLMPDGVSVTDGKAYLLIEGGDLGVDWSLTGKFMFSDVGGAYSQENPAVQISVN